MKTTVTFIAIAMAALTLQVSCMAGQSGTGEGEAITTGAPEGIRTSSDMNISPSNMTTSEPAIRYADTTKTPKPAVNVE
ncbi:hypothetical protein ACLI09_12095 [Flavobacterium sp. RHBU_24]|uniref:hypothetical protein n=1 Tax=Flavobacterium sp. RHBU_24 TaxID=3391185 RepID=UPI0039853F7B